MRFLRAAYLSLIPLVLATLVVGQTAGPVPSVSPYGIVSSSTFRSSFSPTAAPGSLITIFGKNLSRTSISATTPPFTTQLPGSGTRVLFGSVPAPLILVSPEQVNVQVPFGLSGATVDVVVQNEDGASLPVRVNLVAMDPGIISVASANSPPLPGETLTITATGLGSVTPPVPDGAAASFSPISHTVNLPLVRIGGELVEPLSSSLVPGLVGV
jgi:uncharacterized protein (TIGR03437 family)